MPTISLKRQDKGPAWWRSARYLLAFMAAFGMACFFLQRVNLNMAVVCMVNHTAVDMMTSGRRFGGYRGMTHNVDWVVGTMNSSFAYMSHIVSGPAWWRSSRYLLAFLAASGYACFFLQRVNLNMAVVCMVNHTAVDMMTSGRRSGDYTDVNNNVTRDIGFEDSSLDYMRPTDVTTSDVNVTNAPDLTMNGEDECTAGAIDEAKKEDGELDWSKETQGLLISSLFWGYFLLNLPAQIVIQKTGSKNLALASVLVMSLLSLLAPIAARTHVWALMSIRISQGIATALGVSAIYAIWGGWAPKEDRATLLGIVFTGGMFANITVFPVTGFLCRHGFAGGWPSVFYVFAMIGIGWCILWAFLVYEMPESHPRIDPAEKKYIISQRSFSTRNNAMDSIPWLKLLTSMPVWAVTAATISYTYPFFTFMAVLPQYMKEILKFDIQSNGIFLMLPYISLYIFTNGWAYICQVLASRRLLSVGCIRKLSAFIGGVLPNAVYITISFLDCTQATAVVVAMPLAVGISGFNLQCFLVNPYDIAPRYATAVFCLSNTISVGMAIISPYVVAALTIDKTREQWQLAFFSTVGVSIACLIFYLVFGSAREMNWAKGENLVIEFEEMKTEKRANETEGSESKLQSLLEEKNIPLEF